MKNYLNNQQMINLLHKRGDSMIPIPEKYNPVNHYKFYEEKILDPDQEMIRVKESSLEDVLDYYRKVQKAILDIQKRDSKACKLEYQDFENLIANKISVIREQKFETADGTLDKISEYLKQELLDEQVLRSICHGNLKVENCVLDEERELIGIYGWEFASRHDLCFIDNISFLLNLLELRHEKSWEILLDENFSDAAEYLAVYQEYFIASQSDVIPLFPAFLVFWIDRMYKYLTFDSEVNRNFISDHISKIADIISTKI
jgi:hypothetical protein